MRRQGLGYHFIVDMPYVIPTDPPIPIIVHIKADLDAQWFFPKLAFGFQHARLATGV